MLRYNKSINDLPSNCPCGHPIDHAMSCKKGVFVHARQDEIRDIQATLLKEIIAIMLKESHTCNLLLGKYSLDQQTLETKQDLI